MLVNQNLNRRFWCGWPMAISSEGISTPVIRPQRAKATNSCSYIGQCLPKLKEFIGKYHTRNEIMSWPDLASIHYSTKTLNWLTQQNISFVPENDNPPNIPQARPIEDFWAVLKREAYEKGWKNQNEAEENRNFCLPEHGCEDPKNPAKNRRQLALLSAFNVFPILYQ